MFTFRQQVSRRKLAWAGFVLLVAPFYFVIAAILKYRLGVGRFFDPLAAFSPSLSDFVSLTSY